ncbi:uncharacterized protein N0V89_002875 [Didymosphaeria variabile]|uniref:MYND-type zinc finger protein samB n=1 Tax=Didymosphaeria variabile TaxID=1932322 RepID=A0A9W8XTG1_9PLEO|nr:uncharacterized protein N0V89_002875 [Didymosphaeria variabile]KAJ4358294.1 hypothetical protein N0V89_002875 [Didymosphaeria variabile]
MHLHQADWKSHKKLCSQQASSSASAPNIEHAHACKQKRGDNLEKYISDPFTRIDKGTYLHDRPEKDVFKLLVDAFRMRKADAYKMEGKTTPDSVYTGTASSIVPFRRFLLRVELKRGYMPSWWNSEKKKECEEFGETGGDFSDLRKKATKENVMEHYKDEKMPMQLRMFAEEALGEPAPGTLPGAGAGMRALMTMMEAGGTGDGLHYSMHNISERRRG